MRLELEKVKSHKSFSAFGYQGIRNNEKKKKSETSSKITKASAADCFMCCFLYVGVKSRVVLIYFLILTF